MYIDGTYPESVFCRTKFHAQNALFYEKFFRFTNSQSLDFSFFYLFENVCKIHLFRKDI